MENDLYKDMLDLTEILKTIKFPIAMGNVAIFNAIVQKKGLEPVVDAVQSVIGGIDTAKDTNSVEDVSKEKNNLQSSANYSSGTAQDAAANLQAMVEKIKKR